MQRSDFNDYRADVCFIIDEPRRRLELFRDADASFFAIIAKLNANILSSR